MTGLVSCNACRRHVREGATACPFCGADVTGAVAPTIPRITRARLTRGAVYAVALAAAACGGPEPAEGESSGGEVVEAEDAAGDDEVDPRLRDHWEDPRRRRVLPECVHQGTCPAPPYGAPPAGELVV